MNDADAALEWLQDSEGGDDWCGFDPTGWRASVWVLHAMYESEELPGGLTHDDEHQIELASGMVEPQFFGEVNVDELLKDAVVVGAPLGRSSHPGRGWRRLKWAELREQLGLGPLAGYPNHATFPYRSWPANIRPPAEGTLDREQFVRLLEHLAEVSPDGADCECLSFFGRLAFGNLGQDDDQALFRARLSELLAFYDDESETSVGPTNIWPDDRSWFIYSDYDLWGTKISGSDDLIGRLLIDSEIEAAELVDRQSS